MSAALCILALVAGCEPTASQLAANRVAARTAAAEALENQAVWVGTVTGYKGLLNDKIVLDYGGEYTPYIQLSHLSRISDCANYSDNTDKAYIAAIHKFAPVGARIAFERSQHEDGTYAVELGVVRSLKPDGTANLAAPSLNERMAAAGLAVPDPAPDGALTAAQTIAKHKSDMWPQDLVLWSRVITAYQKAYQQQAGPLGVCFRAARSAALASPYSDDEFSRGLRIWILGRDGIQGTKDDYTFGDRRDRNGVGTGGSFNVPDNMCMISNC